MKGRDLDLDLGLIRLAGVETFERLGLLPHYGYREVERSAETQLIYLCSRASEDKDRFELGPRAFAQSWGMKARRIAGSLDSAQGWEAVVSLDAASLVIADLSDLDPWVMQALATAQARAIPVLLAAEHRVEVPAAFGAWRLVRYEVQGTRSNFAAKLDETLRELYAQEPLLKSFFGVTPPGL